MKFAPTLLTRPSHAFHPKCHRSVGDRFNEVRGKGTRDLDRLVKEWLLDLVH